MSRGRWRSAPQRPSPTLGRRCSPNTDTNRSSVRQMWGTRVLRVQRGPSITTRVHPLGCLLRPLDRVLAPGPPRWHWPSTTSAPSATASPPRGSSCPPCGRCRASSSRGDVLRPRGHPGHVRRADRAPDRGRRRPRALRRLPRAGRGGGRRAARRRLRVHQPAGRAHRARRVHAALLPDGGPDAVPGPGRRRRGLPRRGVRALRLRAAQRRAAPQHRGADGRGRAGHGDPGVLRGAARPRAIRRPAAHPGPAGARGWRARRRGCAAGPSARTAARRTRRPRRPRSTWCRPPPSRRSAPRGGPARW